jgi:ribose 1,5-bisphosphokinase PhnN
MVVVLVIGPSASGKSRLIAGVERLAAETGVTRGIRIAKRATTRAAREDETLPAENVFLDGEDFQRAAKSGALDVHWKREISREHINRYGFALAREMESGSVLILSANNYLNWERQPPLVALRAEGRLMVVRVCASMETRLARLRARRPKLSDLEIASRMADLPASLLSPADHVVPNDPEFERTSEWEMLRLINAFRFSAIGSIQPPPATSSPRAA